jgi:V/A-type H+-transporting ATPase subunit D
MADKPKFNKTSLKAQRDALAKYNKFLPILQLKKMQLMLVIRRLEPQVEAQAAALAQAVEASQPWAALLSDPAAAVGDFLQVERVETGRDNIAGVEVPEFQEVVFAPVEYSLFSTPAWLDLALEALRSIVGLREELKVLREKERLLRAELATTTQRVNLFEKKLIPELKANIRRIKIFLGDEETAAVGRAKLAKAKLSAAGAQQA